MVSPGVPRDAAEHLGFGWAASVDEALAAAFHTQGKNARVAVLRHGGYILPVIAQT